MHGDFRRVELHGEALDALAVLHLFHEVARAEVHAEVNDEDDFNGSLEPIHVAEPLGVVREADAERLNYQ